MKYHKNHPQPSSDNLILIIGYGNDLRSDDGVGQKIANQIQNWQIPHIQSIALHQLTPELAETISEVKKVIFIDVYPASEGAKIQIQNLEPTNMRDKIGHISDPRSLLALCQALYNHLPEAWMIAIPGVNFDFGEILSPTTEQGMNEALAAIDKLIK